MRLLKENGSEDCTGQKSICKIGEGEMLRLEAVSDDNIHEVRPAAMVNVASTQFLVQDASTRTNSLYSAGAKNARGVDLCHDSSSGAQLHLINPVNENVNKVATNGTLTQHEAIESPPSTPSASFAWSGVNKAGELSACSVGVGGESVLIHTGVTPCLSPSNSMASIHCSSPQSQTQFSHLTRDHVDAVDSRTLVRKCASNTQKVVNGPAQDQSIMKTALSESTASVLTIVGKDSCTDCRIVSATPLSPSLNDNHIEPRTGFPRSQRSTVLGAGGHRKSFCIKMDSQTHENCDGELSSVGQDAVQSLRSNPNPLMILDEAMVGDGGTGNAVLLNVCGDTSRVLESVPTMQTVNLRSNVSNMVLLPVPSKHVATSHLMPSSDLSQVKSFNLRVPGWGEEHHICTDSVMQVVDQNSVPLRNPQSSCELEAVCAQASLSADAQTDTSDLMSSVVIAPPPSISRNNREQRKRERRERRRGRSQSIQLNQVDEENVGTASRNHGNARVMQSSSTSSGLLYSPHLLSDLRNQVSATPEALATDCQHSNSQDEPNPANVPPTTSQSNANELEYASTTYPDLLNAHFPPPYSTLPPCAERRHVGSLNPQGAQQLPVVAMPVVTSVPPPHTAHMQIPLPLPPPPPPPILVHTPPNCLPPAAQPTIRYHFSPAVRASRRSLRASRGVSYASEDEPKSCCGMSTSQAVSIRWFIIIIAVIGISCTVAGTALGAAYSNGREHLTLSLLMIGVGVVLLTVSAVAWRLTAHESGLSCRVMLGFSRRSASRGDGGTEPNRRFVPRLAPTYGRPHHPYAAMMYPDFHYRPPPPSYQASMQEYRLRLLLLERSNPTIAAAAALSSPTALTMVPPPPAYRPYNGTLRNTGNCRNEPDYSRPPSYRSRSSGNNMHGEPVGRNRTSLDPSAGHHLHHMMLESPLHSRDPSLLSYLSQQSLADNVSVVSGHALSGAANGATAVVTVMQAVSVGMDLSLDMEMFPSNHHAENINKGPVERHDSRNLDDKGMVERFASNRVAKKGNQDGNLVRIVQTTDSSQVIRRESVIVTVSGSNHNMWDQQLHCTNNQHNSHHLAHHHNSRVLGVQNGSPMGPIHADNQTNSSCTSQVQILAHL
ncbi:unnamed protein product [Allacma fusca]|uniref:Uncharacterized protein n=1 Tax=Allacma fusca TaxID=39272 RepID=A0A8J2NSW2_9HEXA|nr:unnamed protein product [Allacma fusca]